MMSTKNDHHFAGQPEETERQRDKETERQRDRETERGRETFIQRGIETDGAFLRMAFLRRTLKE